jgi:hypothetical protein
VSSRQLCKRILVVLGAAAMFLLFAALTQAHASPIHPDIKQLVKEPAGPPPKFEPARAGWNGPESAPPSVAGLPLELTSAGRAQAIRQALALVMIPDPRVLVAILISILLLRKLHGMREERAAKVATNDGDWQMPRAA